MDIEGYNDLRIVRIYNGAVSGVESSKNFHRFIRRPTDLLGDYFVLFLSFRMTSFFHHFPFTSFEVSMHLMQTLLVLIRDAFVLLDESPCHTDIVHAARRIHLPRRNQPLIITARLDLDDPYLIRIEPNKPTKRRSPGALHRTKGFDFI